MAQTMTVAGRTWITLRQVGARLIAPLLPLHPGYAAALWERRPRRDPWPLHPSRYWVDRGEGAAPTVYSRTIKRKLWVSK